MKTLTDICRQLRKKSTPAEQILWSRLRGRRIGYKFRRQHQVKYYIADFYCHEINLIIEVDGGIHGLTDVRSRDSERDAWLKSAGFRMMRVTNTDVLNNTDEIVERIKSECDSLKTSP